MDAIGPMLLSVLFVIRGMMVPEAVCYDPGTRLAYVSNIVGEGWADDHEAFITRVEADGTVDVLRWRTETADVKLSAPKGMCIHGGVLYCADIDRVHRFPLDGGPGATWRVAGAGKLNDMTTDGKLLYVSDTARGKLVVINPETGEMAENPTVESINGITFHEGVLYGVSWDLHDVYTLDPTGAKAPEPMRLAQHFKNLDGIEALADDSLLVSDFMGNAVYQISPDRRHALRKARPRSPADIAVDREGGRLFVPEFRGNRVVVYGLK